MRIAGLVLTLCLAQQAAAAQEEALLLPSGLEARFLEVLTDRPGGGLAYRFRFVTEGFTGGEAALEAVMADMDYLCQTYAVTRLPGIGPMPSRIVISLADRPSEFGVFDPDVTQVFEAYSVQDGVCIWEMF